MSIHPYSSAGYPSLRQDTTTSRNSSGNATLNTSNTADATALQQLLGRLADNIPGMTTAGLQGLNAADFSPARVADRIAGFVAQGLDNARDRGASDAELNQLYQAAKSGVERGFAEANEILTSLQLYTEEIAATVEETYDLTMSALNKLQQPGDTDLASGTQRTSITAAERFSRAESFSLEVMTNDGDRITIDFSNNSRQSSIVAGYGDIGGAALAAGIEITASSQYQFSVTGDLDPDELAAIQTLIQDIGMIADDFFSGGIQDALNRAVNLEMDKSQLMNLNVSMTQSLSYSAATQYHSVQQLEQPLGNNGKHLGQIKNNLERFISHPGLNFLNDPASLSGELFRHLLQQDTRYLEQDENSQQLLDRNASLLESLLTSKTQENTDI